MTPLLETRGLGKTFGGLKAVQGVDLRVGANRIVSVIGPNGAGKTTLLRVILGLVEPSDGRVLVDGEPLHNRNKASIGYVPQKLGIDPDMPLRGRDVV